jgi:hypothetical protein
MYDPATLQFQEPVGLDLSGSSESKGQNEQTSSEIRPKLTQVLLYNLFNNNWGTDEFVPVHAMGE